MPVLLLDIFFWWCECALVCGIFYRPYRDSRYIYTWPCFFNGTVYAYFTIDAQCLGWYIIFHKWIAFPISTYHIFTPMVCLEIALLYLEIAVCKSLIWTKIAIETEFRYRNVTLYTCTHSRIFASNNFSVVGLTSELPNFSSIYTVLRVYSG